MAKRFLGLLLAFLSFMTFGASAQTTWQTGLGIGVSFPSGDYDGTTLDYYKGTAYGLSTGYTGSVRLRALFNDFSITTGISYSAYGNSGESEPGKGRIELAQSITSFVISPEYHVRLRRYLFHPYAGVNLGLHMFSGKVKFNGVSRVSSGTHNMETVTRIGFGARGGVIIKMCCEMSIDLGVTYDFLNAVGKSWNDRNPNKDQRLDTYLSLNDDRDPEYMPENPDHPVSSARSIQAMTFFIAFMFDL